MSEADAARLAAIRHWMRAYEKHVGSSLDTGKGADWDWVSGTALLLRLLDEARASALTARRQMRLEAVAYHERLFTEIRDADGYSVICGAHMSAHKEASEYFQGLPDEPAEPQKGEVR